MLGKLVQIPGLSCPCSSQASHHFLFSVHNFEQLFFFFNQNYRNPATVSQSNKRMVANIISNTGKHATSAGYFIRMTLLSFCGFSGVKTQQLPFTMFSSPDNLQFYTRLLIKGCQLHLVNSLHFSGTAEKQGWQG